MQTVSHEPFWCWNSYGPKREPWCQGHGFGWMCEDDYTRAGLGGEVHAAEEVLECAIGPTAGNSNEGGELAAGLEHVRHLAYS